jgi:hypothetical protein
MKWILLQIFWTISPGTPDGLTISSMSSIGHELVETKAQCLEMARALEIVQINNGTISSAYCIPDPRHLIPEQWRQGGSPPIIPRPKEGSRPAAR